MADNAPGKHFRKGVSLVELIRMFPDNATAEKWIADIRWPDGVYCPECGSLNVQTGAKHKTMPFRCRDCRKRFSVRTGTVMQSSNLGCQIWVLASYLLTTGLKGASSMKLHRDLDITQKSAWHLAHRIRETWDRDVGLFGGPVEVDETYMGRKRKNMPASTRKVLTGCGAVGKSPAVGVKDRETKKVVAEAVQTTDAPTLQGFVEDHTSPGATVYTDEAKAYEGMSRAHEAVKHSVGEYVRDQTHTNGMESFWSMLKRGCQGTHITRCPTSTSIAT